MPEAPRRPRKAPPTRARIPGPARPFRPRTAKPPWLKIRLKTGKAFTSVRQTMQRLSLNTVCEEARCPNIYECWGEQTATFMILGDVCTRRCGFCAVLSGTPRPVDPREPAHLAEAVARMGLAHAVITSVDRDDLPDGGASQFAAVIRAIRETCSDCAVEVLTPDFRAAPGALQIVLEARPDVFAHNIETVPRLYKTVRPGSVYEHSLALLAQARNASPAIKSGFMLGLGETREEVDHLLVDLRSAGVDIVTIGQYLQPTSGHLPVTRYVPPAEFDDIRKNALPLGFRHVESGPLVRSSYRASRHLKEMDAGSGGS